MFAYIRRHHVRLLSSVLLAALGAVPLAAVAQEPAPLLPLHAFFENPDFKSPKLSEDGAWLAVLLSDGDRQVVAVRAIEGGALTPLVRIDQPEMRLSWLEWANSTRILLSASVRMRVEGTSRRHTQLFGIDRDGKNYRWLGKDWPKYGLQGVYQVFVQDDVIDWLPADPDHVLIRYWAPTELSPSVQKLDVATGRVRMRQREEHDITTWYSDLDGEVRAGESESREEYVIWARPPGGRFERVSRHAPFREDGPVLIGLHADPDKLYVTALKDGRLAIYEFEITAKKLGALVYAHPEVDVEALAYAPGADRRVVGVRFTTDAPQIHFFDPALASEYKGLAKAFAAEFGRPVEHEPYSESSDGKRVILRVSTDVQAAAYYFYDRDRRALSHLFDESPKLPTAQMAPTKPISFAARDGVQLHGYLTLPLGSTGKNLPAIVLVHGGPWARDSLGWDAEVQAFANRGFAVFQINFRGSSGYGKAFREAGYREWGWKIQDDISDGAKWLADQGVADRDRIGIYGASFGGYAALIGATKTPELYRAAAAYAAVTDIELLINDDAKYDWGVAWHKPMVGGGRADAERLRQSSPLRLADRAAIPVLLGHGDEDDRVDVHHSRKMAAALRKAGKPVEYLEFEHEIHGFRLEANRIRWYEALIAFFEKNLAPRAALPANPDDSLEEPRS
jgi:dipeptidyl aminopeptidase/acylaminoacyl peptidase